MSRALWILLALAGCDGANDGLTSIDGLSSLTFVEEDLRIYDNASLCQSDAEAFAASLRVGGTVYVEGNGSARTDCE